MTRFSTSSLIQGALTAGLISAAIACSGNSSLGGGGANSVGGSHATGGSTSLGGSIGSGGSSGAISCGTAVCGTGEECCNASCSICSPIGSGCIALFCSTGGSPSTGGASGNGGTVSTGGKIATGGDCGMIECFRAIECVEYCGGPIVSSGCCPCGDGTFDRMTGCSGSGGSTGAGGSSATGGKIATGGTSSSSTYQPCAGKPCGSNCTICPPNSSDCFETAVMKSCNSSGQCMAGTAQCGTTPSTGGATAAGGNSATGGVKPSGGSVASGGTTGGITCGTAVCGAGEECCNASCGICVPKGGGCIALYCTSGGSSSLGGATGAGGTTSIADLHSSCTNGTCPSGLTPVTFYGIGGTSGPQFCSCEIPCIGTGATATRSCPTDLKCTGIADGPQNICVFTDSSGYAIWP